MKSWTMLRSERPGRVASCLPQTERAILGGNVNAINSCIICHCKTGLIRSATFPRIPRAAASWAIAAAASIATIKRWGRGASHRGNGSAAARLQGPAAAVFGNGYTELFFLDEVTALAAGHRPCFECRRADAIAFAESWGGRASGRARRRWTWCCTHERLDGRGKRMHRADARCVAGRRDDCARWPGLRAARWQAAALVPVRLCAILAASAR